MKKIVLGLVCAMSFSFATTSEDNQKNVDETLKKFYTKIENFRKQLHSNDSEEKIKYWEEEANQGDVTAQFIIARTYYYNVKDYKKAIEWYEKIINQEFTEDSTFNGDYNEYKAQKTVAQNNLGNLYYNGHGVKQDKNKAKELYEKACNGGNDIGCFNLGTMYEKAEGVKKDYSKAIELYKKSCDNGYSRGCFNLGYMYEKAQGVNQDKTKAKELYKIACDDKIEFGCKAYRELK